MLIRSGPFTCSIFYKGNDTLTKFCFDKQPFLVKKTLKLYYLIFITSIKNKKFLHLVILSTLSTKCLSKNHFRFYKYICNCNLINKYEIPSSVVVNVGHFD